MYTLGIDIGSATSKCVILKDGKEIVGTSLVAAGIGTGGAAQAMEAVLSACDLRADAVTATAVTGYGRNTWPGDGLRISELTAHCLGARVVCPSARTIIDIGGQDSKVISADTNGMQNFLMNDKCAAGTGRFLEVMARILQVDLDGLSALALKADSPAAISNTCTVFAESEVISQLAAGTPAENVAAGICRSVATRTVALAKRLGIRPAVCMSGGVAKNAAVRAEIAAAIGAELLYDPLAQHFGALGAAIRATPHVSLFGKPRRENC